jgi:hypothetical protein
MDPLEQAQWLATHIPHRVRAAIARLPMENSILRGTATIDPHCRTEQDHIYWRCATDSIWEGRLAATRWLIEFVGIKQDDAGQAAVCRKSKKFGGKDVRIDDLDGGVLLDHRALEAHFSAAFGRDARRRQAMRLTSINTRRSATAKNCPRHSR